MSNNTRNSNDIIEEIRRKKLAKKEEAEKQEEAEKKPRLTAQQIQNEVRTSRIEAFRESERNSMEARKRASKYGGGDWGEILATPGISVNPLAVPAPVGNAKIMSKLLDVDESKMPSVSDTNESLEKNIDNVRELPKYSTVRGLFDKHESKGDKKTEPSEMSYVDEHKIKSTVPLVADADDTRMRNSGFKTASDRIGELQSVAQDDPDFKKYVKRGQDYANPIFTTATGQPINILTIDYGGTYNDAIMRSVGFSGVRLSSLTEDEKNVYNYYFGKGEYDKAKNYLKLLAPKLEKRSNEEFNRKAAAFADDHPVLASGVSVGTSLLSGLELLDDIGQYAKSGNKKDMHNSLSEVTRTIRGTVSKDMSGVGRFLYNTGMSGLDSLATMPFGGLGAVFLGSSAAASATNDALERGMSGERALANGVAAGVFEGLFEKFSIGNFKALKDMPVKGFKDVVVNGLKSMGVNASEEMATEIANITYDTVVNGKYANRTWDDMASGEWKNALIDVLGAGISGAVMGAGFNVIGNVGADINAKKAYGGIQNELVKHGMTAPEGSRARELAEKNQKKLDAGKNLAGRTLRYQVGANAAEVKDDNIDAGASYSFHNQTVPTYEELVSKPDIQIVDIGNEDYSRPFKEQRDEIKNGDYAKALYSAPITNKDTGELVFITPSTLTHSFSNSGDNKINAIKHIREIVENAVLTHADSPTHGADNTMGVYTLFGAVRTSDGVRPVRVKIKEYVYNAKNTPKEIQEYFNKNGVHDPYASAYDNKVLVVEKIESDTSSSSALPYDGVTPTDRKYPSEVSTISIADMMALVNKEYQKYLPQKKFDAEEIMNDPEVTEAVADMDTETEAEFTPSDGVVEARDLNAEYFETGRLVPLTAEQEWRKAEAAKAANDTERSGILAGASKADIAIALTVSKLTGRNVIFQSDEYRVKGRFDGKTVFINPNRADGVVSQVLAHELVHSVEGTKGYSSLVKSLKSFIEANNYVDSDGVAHDWDYYVTEAHAAYENQYKKLTNEVFTDDMAHREAAARIIESFFTDTAKMGTSTQAALDTWLADYASSNRNAAARMWYSLSKLARRFKEDIASKFSKSNTPEAQKQREMLRRIEDIRDRFGRALIEAKEAKKARGTNGKAAYSFAGTNAKTADKLTDGSVNSKSKENFSFAEDSQLGTMPMTERESVMRDRALDMYAKLDAGTDIGMPKNMDDPNEYIHGLTGWYRNELGNLVVDHEAPVYLKERSERERAAERHAYESGRLAEWAAAQNDKTASENEVVRKERDEWQVRAEAAEKAKRILERDVERRLAADRQLSPNYTHSRDQVRGIVKELADMFGGHYNDGQIRGFTERLLELYDKIGTDARFAADLTMFSTEISDIITDMQNVRIKNTDNAAVAEQLRTELRTPVYLSETARGDFSAGYGKTAAKYRGKVNFVTKGRGTAVDVRYAELSDAFPDWFPKSIENEADQAKRILEVSDIIREKDFTSSDRYANVGADPDTVRNDDFDKALNRILDGYAELEAVSVTFADGLMRQLEFERRNHQRELARMTEEERAKAEKKHNAEIEKLMREAEAAMEWETKYLRDALSEREGQLQSEENRKKAEAEAKDRRAHQRGRDISDAAIKAARADGSFTKKMGALYERFRGIEDELARLQNECKKYDKVKLSNLSEGMREYVKLLRERRDALAEDKSNLEAYINKVNERVKGIRFNTLVQMIENDKYLKDWKDKSAPVWYAIGTMRRNVLDIAPKGRNSELAQYIINEIIDPAVNATAMATRLKNKVRDKVRSLELSTKAKKGDTMSESQFVQAYAEAKDNIKALETGEGSFIYDKYGNPVREGMNLEEWRGFLNRITEENKGITGDKATMERIERAAEQFKKIYDDLFTLVNAARIRNGYAPVPYHRGYFPHYNNDTMQDNIFAKMLDGFGFRTQDISEKLPTSINGLTATFRPGIRYMGNVKQRSMAGFEGERVVTGAVEGIDRYLEVAADVAYMTDYVQELRSLIKAIRYATTSDATKKRIDDLRADDTLTQDEKQERINEIFANKSEKTKYALSNFVVELEEYANILAGKKSHRDREWESEFGRAIYNLGKKITRNVGANQIVANVSSWITNTVPLTQGTAVMHYHMLTGAFDMIKGTISDDGFAAKSTFLTNRRGSDRLIKTGLEKITDAASFGMPLVDNFVSEWLMRARVAQNMSKFGGKMSRDAAIAEADTFISGMMANRTKAEMPTIFAAQNPLYKAFTTYQLEVANQFAFFKDLWRDDKENVAKFLAQMFFVFVLSRIYNDYFEELTGRRPAFDPLEMLNDLGGDISGYKLAPIGDIMRGKPIAETKKKNAAGAVFDNLKGAAEEIPYIGGLLGGGRIPISSALPDFEALGNAFKGAVGNLYDEDDPRHDGAAGANDVIKNLYKGFSSVIYYGMIPFGGGAIKKVVEGGFAIWQGGSYTYDSAGERQLQYPVYQDSTLEAMWNGVKTILFGKTSTEGGREWVEGGFGQLSVKNTQIYESLLDAGVSQHDAFDAVNTVRVGQKQLGKARALLEIDYLDDKAKYVLFTSLVTTAEKKVAEAKNVIDKKGDFDAFLEQFVKEKEKSDSDSEGTDETEKPDNGSKATEKTSSQKSEKKSSDFEFKIPKIETPSFDIDIDIPKFDFNF